MSPEISIVMPVFNNLVLVKEMINSIILQTFKQWELLIVDDGSEVDTILAIEEFVKSDPRLILIKRNRYPKGAQTCRNIGLNYAKGEYVVFFDSDDYIAPYCLEQRISFIRNNKDVDFAVFPAQKFYSKIGDGAVEWGVNYFKDDLYAFLLARGPFIVWCNIYKTKSIKENGILWDENIKSFQDSDYNIQCLLKGLKYVYAEDSVLPDYFHRETRLDSISKSVNNVESFESHIYLYKKIIRDVQSKYNGKYDSVLRNRSINFLLLSSNKIEKFYFDELADIVKRFKYGYLLYLRFLLFMKLNKSVRSIRIVKYLIFPSLLKLYILSCLYRKRCQLILK